MFLMHVCAKCCLLTCFPTLNTETASRKLHKASINEIKAQIKAAARTSTP